MIFIIYRLISLFFLGLVVREIFDEEDMWLKVCGGIVLIPLLLRFLAIK